MPNSVSALQLMESSSMMGEWITIGEQIQSIYGGEREIVLMNMHAFKERISISIVIEKY